MARTRFLLAPSVPDLAALGARGVLDLIGTGEPLEGEPRAELLARDRGAALWRIPLPGTPGADGRFIGRPRGAGTGWIWVERFEAPPLAELLKARFSHPRSTSLAARSWNLLCHLRAHGVPTPEPLAMGEAGGEPFARRSVLVVRELRRAEPVPDWLAGTRTPAQRRAAARALGLLLARIARAGVVLPELTLRDLFVAEPRPLPGVALAKPTADDGACGSAPFTGLKARGLPEFTVVRVRGGRIVAGEEHVRALQLRGLAREARGLVGVTPRDLLAVWYRARGRGLDKARRRKELARFAVELPSTKERRP